MSCRYIVVVLCPTTRGEGARPSSIKRANEKPPGGSDPAQEPDIEYSMPLFHPIFPNALSISRGHGFMVWDFDAKLGLLSCGTAKFVLSWQTVSFDYRENCTKVG